MDYKVRFKVNKFFNLDDYKTLNIDLKETCITNEDYITHYNSKGVYEGRLINKEQLKVSNEFGNECVLYIPYYYYLYKNGYLFDNVIDTYEGMQPYYCWCPSNNIRYVNNGRRDWRKYFKENNPVNWNPYPYNPLIYNDNDHVNNFDKKYMELFNYKEYYKTHNQIIKFNNNKPIVFISNKICKEWGMYPINYFTLIDLRKLFDLLLPKYNIIYSCNTNNIKDYSYDNNDGDIIDTGNDNYNELDFLQEDKYVDRDDIVIFETFIKLFKYDYNKTKLITYANCDNYISVQGGNSYLMSYFFKNMFILHKYGNEIQDNINTYENWFMDMNKEKDKKIIVDNDFNKLYDNIENILIN